MNNVLITSTEFARDHWDEMEQLFTEKNYHAVFYPGKQAMKAGEICDWVQKHAAKALLVYSSSDEVTRQVFATCPSLKVVSRHGVGVENIDLAAAAQHGVAVKTTEQCDDFEAVADLTLGLMINLARQIGESGQELKSGRWVRRIGSNVWRKTLGIMGFGRIGQAVAKRAAGFDMEVLVYDPYLDPARFAGRRIAFCDKEDLLRASDFVTLHCRLNENTKHLIGAAELSQMKPTAFLVNTARAGLVNQSSLYQALSSSTIAGAAIDVFNTEPATADPWLQSGLKNLVLTPHVGSYTRETLAQMDRLAVLNITESE